MAANHIISAALAVLGSSLLSSCVGPTAHQNFVNIMEGNVGRSAYDPYVYRVRNRNLRVGTKQLSNGNIEEEFKGGRGLTCRVFFEVNEKAEKIAGWRYEGTDEDCGIAP